MYRRDRWTAARLGLLVKLFHRDPPAGRRSQCRSGHRRSDVADDRVSDDDAASALYPLAGARACPGGSLDVASAVSPPTNVPNYWGLTRITARAMVNFYAQMAEDPGRAVAH